MKTPFFTETIKSSFDENLTAWTSVLSTASEIHVHAV